MNVTPLIDVLLVLIIIFMVIVTQSRTKGLEAQVPQPSDTSTSTPVRTIVIQLEETSGKDQPPTVKINSQEVSWAELEPRLFDIFKQRAEKVAFVEGDDDVEFRFVADVIDEARQAGVDRVGLMPKQMAQR